MLGSILLLYLARIYATSTSALLTAFERQTGQFSKSLVVPTAFHHPTPTSRHSNTLQPSTP